MENIILNTLDWKKSSCKSMEIPTDDEVKALNKMREIRKRAAEIKKELSHMASDASPSEKINRAERERELIELKKEWKDWEKKRDEAARERMIALGHLEPDQSN